MAQHFPRRLGWLFAASLCALQWTIWSTVGVASPVMMPHIKLDLKERNIRPYSTIRVKIFPHEKNYPPQGYDSNRSAVTLTAATPCRYYQGTAAKPGYAPKLLGLKAKFEITAATLEHPLWIACDGPVTVHRGATSAAYSYLGTLYVRRLGNALEIINTVPIESYLRGVVPSEVYGGWPMETLKSQAVAARTYAVYHLAFARQYRQTRFYDVDDTVLFQAYTGVTGTTPRTDEAIAATTGQILTYHGSVIQAYYHADSGGRTESAEHVWSQAVPYCESKAEPFGAEHVKSHWEETIELERVGARLAALGAVASDAVLVSLAVPVAGRTASGRVKVVTVGLKDGSFRQVDIHTFKKALDFRPQSTLFTLDAVAGAGTPTRYLVKGLGSGHGVGMSQQGAQVLAASKGWDYRKILSFYYSGIRLCSIAKKQPLDASVTDCYAPRPTPRQETVVVEAPTT